MAGSDMSSAARTDIFFQLVNDAQGVEYACAALEQTEALGFDTETTELDPYRGELRLVQLSDGRSTYVFDVRAIAGEAKAADDPAFGPLRRLLASPRTIKVAHNAKFDAKWVRHHLGAELANVFDTYLASQLAAAGDSDRKHSLADVAAFYTNTNVDKSEQVSDWAAAELSQSQIEYAARDAMVMLPLYQQLAERLRTDGLDEAARLEFECLMPIAQMELNGVYLDQDRWREQLERVRAAQAKAADELQEMLSAGVAQASLFGRTEINLDSQQQVTDALLNLGIPVPGTTRGWQLQPLAEQYPVVAKLIEYRSVAKALSSFGENILDFVEPQTGRIHADFRQIGAPSGRFSCSNPNLQQIPHDQRYRRCFTAPPGRRLVMADYSQIELRILADFSGDQRFIQVFESGADLHASAAAHIFGVPPGEVTAEQRSFAKRLNFGIVYGIGASRLALTTGMSQTEAEDTMRKYFGTFRELDRYLQESGRRAVTERTARTASGRLMRLRFDETDKQAVGAARRNGVNMPIQGTSADILKRALRLLHDRISGTSARLVNIVHDEVIVECDAAEAEGTAVTLESSMRSAGEEYIKKVPVKVDVHVGEEWSK
jgi:DNA polymerase I